MAGKEARDESRQWLLMRIAECMADTMGERTAERLSVYSGAYNALCQWEADRQQAPEPLTLETATEWSKRLQNEDGSTGPHWTLEQAKQLATQRSIPADPLEFWLALNLMYSDYSKVAKKHNVGGSIDFYVDMAKAFLDDKDAGPDKLAKYYEFVVK